MTVYERYKRKMEAIRRKHEEELCRAKPKPAKRPRAVDYQGAAPRNIVLAECGACGVRDQWTLPRQWEGDPAEPLWRGGTPRCGFCWEFLRIQAPAKAGASNTPTPRRLLKPSPPEDNQ